MYGILIAAAILIFYSVPGSCENDTAPIWLKRFTYSLVKQDGPSRYYFNFYQGDTLPGSNVEVYSENSMKENWALQNLFVVSKLPDELLAYMLGYVENMAILPYVKAHWRNTWSRVCNSESKSSDCSTLKAVLQNQIEYTFNQSMIPNKEINHQLLLTLWQLKGATDAFNGNKITDSSMLNYNYLLKLKEEIYGPYMISVSGDLPGIATNYNLRNIIGRIQKLQMTANAVIYKHKERKHSIVMGHVTRTDYSQMLRVGKTYNIQWRTKYNQRNLPGAKMFYSSYPGAIGSLDEFYYTRNIRAMMSANENMFSKVNPPRQMTLKSGLIDGLTNSVPSSLRALVSLRLARSVNDFVKGFIAFDFNTGTSGSWILFDAKKFSPNTGYIAPNSALLAECYNRFCYTKPLEEILNKNKYWAQYGIPYVEQLQKKLGYDIMRQTYGSYFSYSRSPFGRIIQRDIKNIHNYVSFYKMMRFNNAKTDKLARCSCSPPYSYSLSLSGRGDLNLPNGMYRNSPWLNFRTRGAIDYKTMQTTRLGVILQHGPTKHNVREFKWSQLGLTPPEMHPDIEDGKLIFLF